MIVVLADDLTGASEIAGVCLKQKVDLDFFVNDFQVSSKEVVVVCTNSRSMSEKEALQVYENLLEKISVNDQVKLFKKCDSILRGWVLSELIPLFDEFGFKKIVLQPSNPIAGRVIREGKYFIDQNLISETPFKDDPDFPAFSEEVLTLLKSRNKLFFEKHKLFLNSISSILPGVYLEDAATVSDLKYIASQPADLRVGSAAFFEQFLLNEIYFQQLRPTLPDCSPAIFLEKTLILGGSFHPETRKLPATLNVPSKQSYYFPDILLQELVTDAAIEAFSNSILSDFNGGNLYLGISSTKVNFPQSSVVLAERLNRIAELLVSSNAFQGIFISGGASSWDFVNRMNYHKLIPIAEIQAGIVQFFLPTQNIYLTLKPGSYPLNFN